MPVTVKNGIVGRRKNKCLQIKPLQVSLFNIKYSYYLLSLILTHILMCHQVNGQLTSLFHELPEQLHGIRVLEAGVEHDPTAQEESEVAEDLVADKLDNNARTEPMWLLSGKFQGDIDGIDSSMIKKLNSAGLQMNVLKNKQLIWPNGIIPYELDEAFTQNEVRLLEKAFRTYRKRTCIRFRPHTNEKDYLFIVKGLGCYSQVGRTGGKQEISLGRGCLYHEIVLHEIMHAIGAWHEHSRADRDEHVKIRWENILTGMESQFDIISPALQDTQGVKYDYRSIMHYDSAAFSRNGKNTIEAMEDGFTNVIGSAKDLSELDVLKLNKLYQCPARTLSMERRRTSALLKKGYLPAVASVKRASAPANSQTSTTLVDMGPPKKPMGSLGRVTRPPTPMPKSTKTNSCQDHFLDCPGFKEYCRKVSFFFVMKAYCPHTCNHC